MFLPSSFAAHLVIKPSAFLQLISFGHSLYILVAIFIFFILYSHFPKSTHRQFFWNTTCSFSFFLSLIPSYFNNNFFFLFIIYFLLSRKCCFGVHSSRVCPWPQDVPLRESGASKVQLLYLMFVTHFWFVHFSFILLFIFVQCPFIFVFC